MTEDKTLYEKTVSPSGRVKYVTHSLMRDMCGWEPGHYRLWIRHGSTHIQCDTEPVEPARAEVLARKCLRAPSK